MEDNKEKIVSEDIVVEEHKEETKKEKRNKHKEQVEALEREIESLKDKLMRNLAELENFKKRMTQERINDRKFASKGLIAEILIPLEQLDKVVHMQTDHELLKNFLIGFKMINEQFYNVLTQDGLKEIDAFEKPFDPKYHYAIEKVSNKEKENGINLEVIQKGYTYKDQILRPAMVKVNEWSEENGEDK